MTHAELSRALFQAFTKGDEASIRGLCATDMVAIQNHGPSMDLDTLIGFSLSVLEIVRDFRYEEVVCTETANGFVEEHSVRGTLPDGSSLKLAACVVAEVEEGRITILREYVDTLAAAPLAKALAAEQTSQQPI